MRAISVRLGLLLVLAAGTATAADPPVQDLADGRIGKIYFESVTPSGFFQLAKGQATQKTVIFGTLHVPSRQPEKLRFGVEPDEPDVHKRLFVTPVIRAFATLRRRRQDQAMIDNRSERV